MPTVGILLRRPGLTGGLVVAAALIAGCTDDASTAAPSEAPSSATVLQASDRPSTTPVATSSPPVSTPQTPAAPSSDQALASCVAADLTVDEETVLEAQASTRRETVTIRSTRPCSIDPVPQVVLILDDGSEAAVEVVQEPLPPGRPGPVGEVDDVGRSTTLTWRTVPEAPDVDPAQDCPTGTVTLVLPDAGAVGLSVLTACGQTFSVTPWDVNAG